MKYLTFVVPGTDQMNAQTEPGPGKNVRRRAFRGWTTSRRAASGSPATSSLHHAGPDPSAFETARRSSPMVRSPRRRRSRRVRHHRVRQPRGSRRDRCGASHRPVRDDRGAAALGELVAHDGVACRRRSRRSAPSPRGAARPGAQERRTLAERHGRDVHDDLVEQSRIGELSDEVSPADDPDIPAAGRRDHLRMHRRDVAAHESGSAPPARPAAPGS